MTNQRRPSSPTANPRAVLTSMTPLFLITILQTQGRCCIRMISTLSLSPAPSSTISTIRRKLPPPELIKDILKDKHNKSQASQVLDMGQFQTRIRVNLFFHLIYVSICLNRNIVVIKHLSISIKSSQYYSKSCQMYLSTCIEINILFVCLILIMLAFPSHQSFGIKQILSNFWLELCWQHTLTNIEALLYSAARGMISLI